jgi:hypothetical protein
LPTTPPASVAPATGAGAGSSAGKPEPAEDLPELPQEIDLPPLPK